MCSWSAAVAGGLNLPNFWAAKPSRLEWLTVACPKCGEEMTQYLTPQEEVEEALAGAGWLETVCSYCQNMIRLDARTFEPMI